MKKIIIEVGSTVTKVDLYDGKKVTKIKNECIFFKKNYKKQNKLDIQDVNNLINIVNEMKKTSEDIYICGTSIFRTLLEDERKEFLDYFKNKTGFIFNIISQEKETELTVIGATRNVKQKVAIFIGGGGSTEIAIYDNDIKEMINTKIGVVDIMNEFPDLANDIATTNINEVKQYIKERLNLPQEKVDILILAGGGHEYFARNSGINYEDNNLYKDILQPIMMDIETRKKDSDNYYTQISLENIKNNSDDPNWWYATRAMCGFVLVVAEAIGAKYIVPTDISMVYGLLKE